MEIIRGARTKAQKIVIYGVEGIGKTTLATQFPEPLFIDTEGSTDGYDVARTQKPKSWEQLLMQIDEVALEKPCKTLVIDTIDWAEQLCAEQLCSKYKWESIAAAGYGAGYMKLKDEFAKMLDKLSNLADRDINVVLVSHAGIRKFEQPDEAASYDRWELKLEKKTAAIIKEWADAILFVNYKTIVETVSNGMSTKGKARGNKRVMYTSHDACWDAKNRWGLEGEVEFSYSTIEKYIPAFSSSFLGATEENTIPLPFNTDCQTQSTTSTSVAPPDFFAPLLELMKQDEITIDELQEFAAAKGHYTKDTPLENYDPKYITGFLVPNYAAFREAVEFERIEVPFM